MIGDFAINQKVVFLFLILFSEKFWYVLGTDTSDKDLGY